MAWCQDLKLHKSRMCNYSSGFLFASKKITVNYNGAARYITSSDQHLWGDWELGLTRTALRLQATSNMLIYTSVYFIFFLFFFFYFFFSYYIQHFFICRPSDSTVPTDAGIEPRTVATGALTVRRSNHWARSHLLYSVIINTKSADIHTVTSHCCLVVVKQAVFKWFNPVTIITHISLQYLQWLYKY